MGLHPPQFDSPPPFYLRNHVNRPLQVSGSRFSCFAGLFDCRDGCLRVDKYENLLFLHCPEASGHAGNLGEREQAVRLLYHWRDIFVEDMESLQATDPVVHTIPIYPSMRPHRAREPIYAADEIYWQVAMFPQMLKGGIIRRGMSPWADKTTWVNKKRMEVNDKGFRWPLKILHTYCSLNNATIKMNYLMKRIEPLLEELAKPERRFYFTADAAHGFYAVPIHPPLHIKQYSTHAWANFITLGCQWGFPDHRQLMHDLKI